VRRLVAALGGALDKIMSDPGAAPPRIKTGSVVVSPGSVLAFDTMREAVAFTMPADAVVPADRRREVRPGIEERWTPIPMNLEHLPTAEVLRLTSTGNIPIGGWRVSYHSTRKGVDFDSMTGDEIRAHIMSLSIAPEDDALYNGFYPTIRGNDVAHHDPTKAGMAAFRGGPTIKGNPAYDAQGRMTHDGTIRGGKEITGGRAEYKRATKGYEQFDKGYFVHVEKIKKAKQAERDLRRDTQLAKIDAKLPRKIGEL